MLADSDEGAGDAGCPRRAVLAALAARRPPGTEASPPLWFVTVTLGGDEVPECQVAEALERLSMEHPFIVSARYDRCRAELRYWDECDSAAGAVGQAMRMWSDAETTACLPRWSVVGLEVHDRDTVKARWDRNEADRPHVAVLGEIRPFDAP